MVSQLWIRKNCSMFKILILFCFILIFKLANSHRRMEKVKKLYGDLIFGKNGKKHHEEPKPSIIPDELPELVSLCFF